MHARTRAGISTSKALADKMGMSARIIGDIENGRRTSYSSTTIAKLEQALGWAEGSVADVVAGGSPTMAPLRYEMRHGEEVAVVEFPATLHDASDAELLAEIARRFARSSRPASAQAGTAATPRASDGPRPFYAVEREEYDLVADDAGGHDHETEDEDREIEP